MGVKATPTIFVGKHRVDGAAPFETLAAAFRDALK
jgi:protein-disulfide isomerase